MSSLSRFLAYFNYLDLRTFIDILIVAFVSTSFDVDQRNVVQLLKGLLSLTPVR